MLSTAIPRKLAAVVVTLSTKSRYCDDEETAFRHARHHLSRYDKFVLIPDDHPAIYPGFIPKRFPTRCFGSAERQRRLLLSEAFYRAFLDYEFILIYDLDTLVFRDDLLTWCRAGYDYIAAPGPLSADTAHVAESKASSGGFSLRRVRSCLRVIQSREYFVHPDEYWQRYCEHASKLQRLVNWPRKLLKRFRCFNDVKWHLRRAFRGGVGEDRFWTEYAPHYDPDFRIAPVDVALRFGFEDAPRECFERTGGRLPFGCHRWHEVDRDFYAPYLLKHGPGSEVRLRTLRDARRQWDKQTSVLARVASRSFLTEASRP
ncbi:MAG TPA: DUF5672 family protein [Vicinamibacterales bacterium]|jgi:hypothetical protein|nr:DUF5672 family protein [Vicinamibacterales bacterium]